MDTVTCKLADGLTLEVPVGVACGRVGQPLDLVGDVVPEQCKHAGAGWSSNLDLRCPRCGSRLFLPTRLLAYLPEATIERMYAAGVRRAGRSFAAGSRRAGASYRRSGRSATIYRTLTTAVGWLCAATGWRRFRR